MIMCGWAGAGVVFEGWFLEVQEYLVVLVIMWPRSQTPTEAGRSSKSGRGCGVGGKWRIFD